MPDEKDPTLVVPKKEDAPTDEVVTEELPDEVLPPDAEEQSTEEKPSEDAPAEEPSSVDLQAQLDAKDAEIAVLKAGQKPAEDVTQPKPGERVSMAQVFVKQVMPEAREKFLAEKDPAKQFDLVVETVNLLVGAALGDHITPKIQQLAAINTELMNEVEIRDLRSDPEFTSLEAQVREQLRKTEWKARAGESPVADIFYRIRGARKNGTVPSVKKDEKPPVSEANRKVLKDLSAGGGASPKPAGVRLTQDQEKDFLSLQENGWPGSRADYYAKWKSRADQAKANGKPLPKTYRG